MIVIKHYLSAESPFAGYIKDAGYDAYVIGSAKSIASLAIANLVNKRIKWLEDNNFNNVVVVCLRSGIVPPTMFNISNTGELVFDYGIGLGLCDNSRGISSKLGVMHYFCIHGKSIPEIVSRIEHYHQMQYLTEIV